MFYYSETGKDINKQTIFWVTDQHSYRSCCSRCGWHEKIQYDIWGDTVNLAARMEQSGVPGKINISQHTYELVKRQLNCVHRGKIAAKNKGEIDMYFVETT